MVKNHWAAFYRGKLKSFLKHQEDKLIYREDFLQIPRRAAIGSVVLRSSAFSLLCPTRDFLSHSRFHSLDGHTLHSHKGSQASIWNEKTSERREHKVPFCLCKSPCQLSEWIHHTFILPFDKELPSVRRWKASSGSFSFISMVSTCSHLIPKATSDN